MRDAVDGAGLNGHVNQIYFKKQTREPRKQQQQK